MFCAKDCVKSSECRVQTTLHVQGDMRLLVPTTTAYAYAHARYACPCVAGAVL